MLNDSFKTVLEYLTRHIYVRHNSGDLNDLGTKFRTWGYFPSPYFTKSKPNI